MEVLLSLTAISSVPQKIVSCRGVRYKYVPYKVSLYIGFSLTAQKRRNFYCYEFDLDNDTNAKNNSYYIWIEKLLDTVEKQLKNSSDYYVICAFSVFFETIYTDRHPSYILIFHLNLSLNV